MGTSASAPVVTGVVSLILEKAKLIGKSLSWRDVKWILAQSAKAPSHVAISKNGYGLRVYDGYGFGIIDANAAVDLVSTWTPVGSAVSAVLPSGTGLITVASSIPNGFNIDDDGLTSSLVISSNANSTKISKIEYIDLNINLSHPNWGELVIQLQHSGTHPTTGAYVTTDIITEEHICKKIDPESENSTVMDCSELDNNSSSNYAFRFGVSRHLGESPVGTWTLKIYDSENNLKSGTLTSWGLKVYGE